MGKVDIASKAWLHEAATDIARFVLGDTKAEAKAIGSVTLPSVETTVDGLLRVRRRGRRAGWLHVEVQTRWKADVPERTFDYWSRGRKRHAPLRSCVFVLKHDRRRGRPVGEHREDVDGRPVLRFRFRAICVWKLSATALLRRGGPSLLPLIPFARGATHARVDAALERLSAVPDEAHRAELQAVLAIFAGNVFPDVPWLGKIPKEILMKSTTVDELERRGEVRGLVRGKRLGKRLGEREATLKIAAKIFRKQLGAAFEPLEPRLAACDKATLDRALELAVDRPSKATLRAKLVALLGR